jgi:hypothetical protein
MPLAKKADAVLFPKGTIGRPDLSIGENQALLRARLGVPVLGAARPWTSEIPTGGADTGGVNLMVRGLDAKDRSLLYHKNDPRAGQDRFEWYLAVPDGYRGYSLGEPVATWSDRLDAIKIGYLKPEPDPEPIGPLPEGAEPDAAEVARLDDATRATIRQLTADPPRLRRYLDAVGMSTETALRKHPEIKAALSPEAEAHVRAETAAPRPPAPAPTHPAAPAPQPPPKPQEPR